MPWSDLSQWNRDPENEPPVMAVIGTLTRGFLVSIHVDDDGFVGNVIATGEGRTVEAAFNRAMRAAERKLTD